MFLRKKTKKSADIFYMKEKLFKMFRFSVIAVIVSAFFSCTSTRMPTAKVQKEECSRKLLDRGIKTDLQLAEFFLSENPEITMGTVQSLALLYIREGAAEGINSDAAFVQMCLETGFLKFGNLVKKEWHNYCGLGAEGPEKPGERFATAELGVRAHIQHLHAYATTEDVKLNQPLVDPRYSWPHKTRLAHTVFELAGTWAMDKEYGNKLDAYLEKLSAF